MNIRVADYITQKIQEAGADTVFLITGGMIMHLSDALYKNKKLKIVCCHHEQAATMAAEAYGRFTGKLGVAYVTTGPGALNTITGVVGAYVDSSPMIIVSGQSKRSVARITGPRQFPLQGFDSIPLFKHITKYAVMLDDIPKIRYEVEKCICLAKTPRVGPVYIECPVDLQDIYFDPEEFQGYTVPQEDYSKPTKDQEKQIEFASEAIKKSKRPCILAGAGVRLSGAIEDLHKFLEKTGIPIITSRLGMDIISNDHPLFVGRPGTYGDRAANFTVQNCDLLLVIGCRLGIGLVSYDFQNFAPKAKKIMVDVDEKELIKPAVVPDIPIKADAKIFIKTLSGKLGDYRLNNSAWVKRTREWKNSYPVDLPEYTKEKEGINSYHFMRVFSDMMTKEDVFLVDTGSCFHVHGQAFKVKYGQRHVITGGLSTMGYMPGSLGVAAANHGKDVYCITGDGSIQMNIQELVTIAYNRLPIKLILINNQGYLLIRHTQNNFCEGHLIGESTKTGVGFPDMKKIADAYGIHYMRVSENGELESRIEELRAYKGPVIFEVMTPSNQLLIPRVASKKLENGQMVSMPYDNMFPFLPTGEYNKTRVIEDVQ